MIHADCIAQNTPSTGEVKGKAEELRQSANQGMGEAAGKAQELKDEAAGKAKEASNEANKKVQQQ